MENLLRTAARQNYLDDLDTPSASSSTSKGAHPIEFVYVERESGQSVYLNCGCLILLIKNYRSDTVDFEECPSYAKDTLDLTEVIPSSLFFLVDNVLITLSIHLCRCLPTSPILCACF